MTGTCKRLLICCPGIPHPSRGASSVLFYHYIERLKREGFEILNILIYQEGEGSEEGLAEFRRNLEEPGRFRVTVCTPPLLFQAKRSSVTLCTSFQEAFDQAADGFDPDLVLCFDLLSAWVAESLACRRSLAWLGDLRFQTYWYHAWYGAKESWYRVKRLPGAWLHARAWKEVYHRVLPSYDSVIVSSKSSESLLAKLGIHSRYLPYPWPEDPAAGERIISAAKNAEPSFLFFGTLTGLGSRSAFHFMTHRLYPKLKSRWGKEEFKIFICGARDLPDWVRRWMEGKPEFEFLGFVDDLAALMKSCHGVLVPIDVPVGNRSRILTAMAGEALVIAHRNAALGNPDLEDGETCFLASTPAQFLLAMEEAYEGGETVNRIIENARQRYLEHFHPAAATEMLVNEIRRLCNSSA